MKNDKAKVLAISLGDSRYSRMSIEDLQRYAGYVNYTGTNLLTVARYLSDHFKFNKYGPALKLVRYFDTDQYKREMEFYSHCEEEAGIL